MSEEDEWLKKRNAENWISFNRALARFIRKAKTSNEIHNFVKAKLPSSSPALTKRLKTGIDFGVVKHASYSISGLYVLTELGLEIYEALTEQGERLG